MASLAITPSVALGEDKQAKASPIACANLCHIESAGNPEHHAAVGHWRNLPAAGCSAAHQSAQLLPGFDRRGAKDQHRSVAPTTTWNHRFQAVGGGGYAGVISWRELGRALSDGYGTASTDTGHMAANPATAPGDGSFGLNPDGTLNWGLIEDFASRSLFEMTAKAKAVTQAFYVLWRQTEIFVLDRLFDRRPPGVDPGTADSVPMTACLQAHRR